MKLQLGLVAKNGFIALCMNNKLLPKTTSDHDNMLTRPQPQNSSIYAFLVILINTVNSYWSIHMATQAPQTTLRGIRGQILQCIFMQESQEALRG